ncbi:hypothetical protein V7793_06020 [Streptomyces sp. KLMMK]|uniref:hypothetical protein n=1 Tax=Streptomyces sp. KLMMK TaxID=3109353 RepID=UPI0030001B0A
MTSSTPATTTSPAASAAGQRPAAVRALRAALRAGGTQPVLKSSSTPPAVTVILPQDDTGTFFLPTGEGLAPDAARALGQALLRWNVAAEVSVVDLAGAPALQIALTSLLDAERLAGLVREHLPEPHAAAHQLREALHAAGIHADDLRAEAQGHQGLVRIGGISAESAAVLCHVLSGRECEDLDLEEWPDLHQLADRLAIDVQTLLSDPVDVKANPACTRCQHSRSHEVTLGTLTPRAARRLAAAVEAAATGVKP